MSDDFVLDEETETDETDKLENEEKGDPLEESPVGLAKDEAKDEKEKWIDEESYLE